jgi:hypothetical protein
MSSFLDRIADNISGPMFSGNLLDLLELFLGFGFGIRLLGPLFVLGFYALLSLHIYTYFTVVLFVLRRRLGTIFGLVWVAIGLALVYNIAYNHFFATFIKPGGPKDLRVTLKLIVSNICIGRQLNS